MREMTSENRIQMIRELSCEVDKKEVFRHLDCLPDSPVYGEMERTYEETLPEALSLLCPKAVIAPGLIPEDCEISGEGKKDKPTKAVFLLVTVGKEISDYCTRAFASGDYVRGMIADAMADVALFSLEKELQEQLRNCCTEWGWGIARRLEAPKDLPMEIQREVFLQTEAEKYLQMKITDGYMFSPVKTSCQIYLRSADPSVFRSAHNCRGCSSRNCIYRGVLPLSMRVTGNWQKEICVTEEKTVLELLQENIPGLPSPCGGRGNCGKCKIQVIGGALPVTVSDRAYFSGEELQEGWRLACQAYPAADLEIWVGFEDETEMQANESALNAERENTGLPGKDYSNERRYAFAVDIGTTTVAIALLYLPEGIRVMARTALNPQRRFGADVITRIQKVSGGMAKELQKLIIEELERLMGLILKEGQIGWNDVARVSVTGNTTMLHILRGYPCEGLGQLPFAPYSVVSECLSIKDMFPNINAQAEVLIGPGISAFVGNDIVSGLQAVGMGNVRGKRMFIDLGTNGEMAIRNGELLLTASTAAGPALEGGNILWGTGSIPGAVCGADFQEDRLCVRTILRKKPIGICGSGVIELAAEFTGKGVIDETGLLAEEWFADGYPVAQKADGRKIVLTQKDIREIQLAKAAIRAGIHTLLEAAQMNPEDVEEVYLAGGFGHGLNVAKAIFIGMFPQIFEKKVKTVGNSALEGAGNLALNPDRLLDQEAIAGAAQNLELSSDPIFGEMYMNAMMFEKT